MSASPEPETAPRRTLAMIHTHPGLIPVFDALVGRELGGWEAFNILDESLLRNTIRDRALSVATQRRTISLIWNAVDGGADAVIVTCSSLGKAVDAARPLCPVPVFRIDEGMALAAVAAGARIGVLATLSTTLDPTSDLILRVAAQQQIACSLVQSVAVGAFVRLVAGDVAGHDALVAKALRDVAPQVDVIVLAQASMARALAAVQAELGNMPVLTSPDLGMKHIALRLAG